MIYSQIMTSKIAIVVCSLLLNVSSARPLLGGRFVTINDVTGILDFSLDIAEMEENTDNLQEREEIYKNVGKLQAIEGAGYGTVKPPKRFIEISHSDFCFRNTHRAEMHMLLIQSQEK